jgi:uncharacterized membrane protein
MAENLFIQELLSDKQNLEFRIKSMEDKFVIENNIVNRDKQEIKDQFLNEKQEMKMRIISLVDEKQELKKKIKALEMQLLEVQMQNKKNIEIKQQAIDE